MATGKNRSATPKANLQCVDVDRVDISAVLSAAEEFTSHWEDYISFVGGPGRSNKRLVHSLASDVLMRGQRLKAAIDQSGLIVPASPDQILLRFGPERLAEKGFAPNLPLRGTTDKVDGVSMLISGITEFLATPEKIGEFSRGKPLLLGPEEQIEFNRGAVAEISLAITRLHQSAEGRQPNDPAKLNKTKRRILSLCRRKALPATAIARKLELSPDHTRRVLAELMHDRWLRNDDDGYRTLRAT